MRFHGITVLELLIALTAVAFVILITVPGSSMVLEKYRMKKTSDNLVNSINTARYEALRRHSTVRICPSSNGKFCRRDGDWNQGWLVFSDGNGDRIAQEIELLESFDKPNEHIRIFADGAVKSSASFNVSGLERNNEAVNGSFVLCYLGSNAQAKDLFVNEDGWVEISRNDSKGCESV
jgi:type IV fimbrial biogenesis protein FimT